MTYKLSPSLAKIKSPITLVINDMEYIYEDGTALTEAIFKKYYLVDSITTKDDGVIIKLKDNDEINDITWIGEEAVETIGFF